MLTEKLLGGAGVCILVSAMATINEQAARFMSSILQGDPMREVPTMVGGGAIRMARSVSDTVGPLVGDNVEIVVFGAVGVVLLGLMARS